MGRTQRHKVNTVVDGTVPNIYLVPLVRTRKVFVILGARAIHTLTRRQHANTDSNKLQPTTGNTVCTRIPRHISGRTGYHAGKRGHNTITCNAHGGVEGTRKLPKAERLARGKHISAGCGAFLSQTLRDMDGN